MCGPTSNSPKPLPRPIKTWPTRSAGPDFVSLPLKNELLRVVLGDPRSSTSPLRWFPSHKSYGSQYTVLELSYEDRSASIEISPCTPTTAFKSVIPDEWFDFFPADNDQWFLKATLKCKGGEKFSALMTANHFQPRKGLLQFPLVTIDGIPAAMLTIDYLCVTPHPRAARGVRGSMFVPRFTGHRGMGSSGPEAPWRVLENSMESFLMAALGESEVKAVELDVQLTRDEKTVIFHDWFFRPQDGDGYPIYDRNVVKVPPYNVTFDQFDKLYREAYQKFENGNDEKRAQCKKLSVKRGDVSPSVFKVKARTLKEVCEELPKDIGILVEIKYPAPNVQDDQVIPYPDKNRIIDLVLDDLVNVEQNYGRNIAFLTFDADLCMMLAYKQRQFPVYFSHCEALDKPCDEYDPRAIDVIEGLRFVLSQRLDGMMLFNEIVKQKPEAIAEIVSRDIPILTYGKSNSKRDMVKHQFALGISGVIADDVDKLVSSFK